jgi:hypothetical protein
LIINTLVDGVVFVIMVTDLVTSLEDSFAVFTFAMIFVDAPGGIGSEGLSATVHEHEGRTSPKTKG